MGNSLDNLGSCCSKRISNSEELKKEAESPLFTGLTTKISPWNFFMSRDVPDLTEL